ncbi:MAG: ATP phosphoribosyltransferase regulatory subunit, partial [Atribacterota bacterium]
DAEIIFLAWTIYQEIGLKNLTLEINNLGCHQCKPQYIEVLKQFLDSHREELCENCRSRMDKNPLRILDCKEAGCQGVLHSSNFPVIQSYLCDDCRHHQDELMDNLARTGVSVIINPYLVRGLDYYIKTAFEIKTGELGSQDAIGGGGRYDHLSDTLGVKGIPGVGFAAGMERIILLLQKQIGETSFREAPLVYLAPLDHPGEMLLLSLSAVLKEHSIPFRLEFADKGIKYHLKKAEKMGISSIVIAGEEEARREIYTVKNLLTGEQNTLDQNILVTDLLGAGRHVTNT